MPLDNLYTTHIDQVVKNENVLILSKNFNKADCNRFLGRNLLAEGYQPVQLCIHNNSSKNYIFSLNRVNLPVASTEAVAKTVHTSTVGRVVGYGAASLILPLCIVPAIVDGVASYKANELLDQDFNAKSAKDQLIPPYSTVNAIIFIPHEYNQENFTVTLIGPDLEPLKIKPVKIQ